MHINEKYHFRPFKQDFGENVSWIGMHLRRPYPQRRRCWDHWRQDHRHSQGIYRKATVNFRKSIFLGRQRRLWTILAITLRWCPQGRRCPQLDHQHRFWCWFRPSCWRRRRRWWWCCRCWSTKGRSQGRILIRRRRRYGFRTFRLKAMPVGFLELQ